MSKKFSLFLFAVLFVCLVNPAFAIESQIVAGAGPSTKIVDMFFKDFSKLPVCADYRFTIMERSVKHKGGIQNSDSFLFGRTGRPLNADESALGKEEIFLAKVPIAFAKGLEVKVSSLTMAQVEQIFTRKITNWSKVGGPDAKIVLVGRESTEALFKVLKADYPSFKSARFDKTFKKDHEVVKFLTSAQGRYAIAFGAEPNFTKFNLLKVKSFSSGVQLGLVFDNKNSAHPVILEAQKYAGSADWKKQVKTTKMLPVN